ncbi:MAG: YqiA/YcfP family alpha/beta fold hydrolase [Xanthomonadales bacterium]|nr:YqiA/YcfP family alpha/beta fold hydrolase [Xanthomonadales bacterium]
MTGGTPRQGLMVFSHGKDSSPRSRKIELLRPMAAERGWMTKAPDYSGMDAAERIRTLSSVIADCTESVVLVGSSMGGVVSVFVAREHAVDGLFLMAPAVYWPGYDDLDHQVKTGLIHIVHGWRDDVVPPDQVIRFAREHRATLHILDAGHRLTDTVDLERLFEAFLDRLEESQRP